MPKVRPHPPKTLIRISGSVVVALLVCSCGSSDSGASAKREAEKSKFHSRIMSKPSTDKRSMFEPTEDSGDKKSFRAGEYGKKEYKRESYRGKTKEVEKDAFRDRDQSSPWAGLTSRESAQEVSSNLTGEYSTAESRDSGKKSRDSGNSYGTGTYKTGDNVIGTKGIENSAPPKIIPNSNTKRGMTEGEIKSLLGKD